MEINEVAKKEIIRDMLQNLENYYREHGILSTSFTCSYKLSCQGNNQNFTGPKSAFVSTGYEAHVLPRLLFLSLDSGVGEKENKDRLPDAVRKQEEIDRKVLTLPQNRHWYRTHELAWCILRNFKPSLQIQDIKKYFAHANSAKCCMNKKQKEKADAILFKNCKRFLKCELEILAPDIIVSQGKEAKEAIRSLIETAIKQIDEYVSIVRLNGKIIFWLHTWHPNNWGAFNKQRRSWLDYSNKVREFIITRQS